jgi:NitT/TauT family transport system substrate-binding protein
MTQLRRRSFVFYSAAVTTGACNRRSRTGQAVRIVLAGTPSSLSYLPHAVAQQLNFYRKQGLRVAADVVPGGTKGAQAVLGGSADVVVGYYDHAVRLAAQGQMLQAFATMTRYPGNVLVLSADKSRIKNSIEDLKHAVVGVSDLGSQSHLFLNYVLARHGLTPADVTPISMGTQQAAIAALERGQLDGWSGFDPGVTQFLKRHPGVRILADARTEAGVRDIFGVNDYPGSVLYAKADWLERNQDTARRLARAIVASLHWIHEHSPEEIMSAVPASYLGEDRAVYREALLHSMSMFSVDGSMPLEGPGVVQKVLGASLENVRTAHLDLTKTYTNEFVTGY